MAISCARQPVIILGMHRSGTTMVAKLLDQLGLFQGVRLQGDHESTYFLSVNDTVFQQVNAAWDNPAPVRALLDNADAADMTLRCIRGDLLSWDVRRYLGLKRYLAGRRIGNLDRPWGWKDPRTVFTLPLWLRLWPAARIVQIVRNGVDVASSLLVREGDMLAGRRAKFDARLSRLSTRSKLRRAAYKGSARCLTLDGAFALWEEYVAESERHLQGVASGNARLSLRYEDILREPRRYVWELAEFCGLGAAGTAGPGTIESVASQVNASRASAYRRDPPLRAFFDRVQRSPWMRKHGYAEDPAPAGEKLGAAGGRARSGVVEGAS